MRMQVVIVNEKKWGDAERELLYKGLEEHGVGKWREISAAYLPAWDEQTLRIKSSRLLGSQSLARCRVCSFLIGSYSVKPYHIGSGVVMAWWGILNAHPPILA